MTCNGLCNSLFEYYGPNHVFKKCISMLNDHECVLLLEKPKANFLCNEARKGITNSKMAKFRCNGLIVLMIYDLITNATLDEVWHLNHNSAIVTWYKLNRFITPDGYDEDLDNVCAKGIHYFLTLEAAKSYTLCWGVCIIGNMVYDENGNQISDRIHYHYHPIIIWTNVATIHQAACFIDVPKIIMLRHKNDDNGVKLVKPSKIFTLKKQCRNYNINQPKPRQTFPRYRGCVK